MNIDALERFSQYSPKESEPNPPLQSDSSESDKNEIPVLGQIKAAITVFDFVRRYVHLSESGTGLCPFHNDNVESFSVDQKQNFWYCFACEFGGSVIDFWMQYRECDFRTAVDQLKEMLLDDYEIGQTQSDASKRDRHYEKNWNEA